jgi:hypothetical protein
MSENTDNSIDNNYVYGFSLDHGRWSHYASDLDGMVFFYDTKSIVKRNNYVRVWIKFGEPINDGKGTRFYKEGTALKELDCGSRFIRSLEWNYLSMKDEYNKYTTPTKWENVEPETAEDALLDEVCARPRKVRKK